jgi:uncharacterized membrane protein YeiH
VPGTLLGVVATGWELVPGVTAYMSVSILLQSEGTSLATIPDPFAVANVLGLLAFAAAGTLKGVEADLDVLGVAVLGVSTALGGGMMRDVLVGRVPVALTSTTDVTVALVGVAGALVAARRFRTDQVRNHPALIGSDAVGLAAFAATGALVGVDAGLSPYGVVVLATLTGVGGGSIADLLLGRTPWVLREDFYATPAVVGGVGFWTAATLGLPRGVPTLGCFVLTLSLRGLALRYDWRLPTV